MIDPVAAAGSTHILLTSGEFLMRGGYGIMIPQHEEKCKHKNKARKQHFRAVYGRKIKKHIHRLSSDFVRLNISIFTAGDAEHYIQHESRILLCYIYRAAEPFDGFSDIEQSEAVILLILL